MDKGAGLNIKKYVAGMEGARKGIQSGVDIPENMTTIKNNFMDLQSSIKAQTGVIQNLQQFHKNMSATNNRNYQAKKFLHKVFDKVKGQINTLFKLVKTNFIENKKKPDFWEKIYQEIDKHMITLRDQADTQEKMFAAVLKFLNAKQEISCQFIKLMLYKKHLLWKDLSVPYDDYIHGQVKAVINLIKSSQQKYGYAPSTIQFKTPKFQTQGEDSSYNSLLQIVMGDFNDLIETIKNYSNLNGQPQVIEGINKNKRTIKGLRQKIEHLTINYEQLLQKYRKLQISKGRNNQNDETNLQQKLQQMETLLNRKQQDIIELKQMNMKNETIIKQYKDKNKQLEDEVSKWQTNQLPKIRDLEQTQKILFDEFTKVKKDLEAYNSIFQAQRQEKGKLFLQVKNQKEKVKGLADLLGKQKRKKKELLAEIARQQQINLLLTDELKFDK